MKQPRRRLMWAAAILAAAFSAAYLTSCATETPTVRLYANGDALILPPVSALTNTDSKKTTVEIPGKLKMTVETGKQNETSGLAQVVGYGKFANAAGNVTARAISKDKAGVANTQTTVKGQVQDNANRLSAGQTTGLNTIGH